MSLRPRQIVAIDDITAAYRHGYKSPLLRASTGFGKTHTSVEMIRRALAKGRRCWFLAHLRELLQPTSERLSLAGINHSFVWAGHLYDRRQMVQVVSVQTAANRLDRLQKPDFIIIDEAHLATAATYQKILEWAQAGPKFYQPGGAHLLSLTATPSRLSGEPMGDVADIIIETCSTQELVDEGLLAPVRYLTPDTPDMQGTAHRGGDFVAADVAAVMDKPAIVGSALDTYMRFGRGRPALGFCVNLASARNYAERFAAAGLRTMAISGDDSDTDRDFALKGLMQGKLDWVFNCKLFVAGVDCPPIGYIADLAPTESLTRYLQGLGRGLRTFAGNQHLPPKQNLIYADHAGNIKRHSNPMAAREWTLSGDPSKKKGSKSEVGKKQCPKCLANVAATARLCPIGHEFEVKSREVEEREGELREIELAEQARQAAVEKRREQGRAQTEEELIAIGRARSMARPELWARHVLRARAAKEARRV